MLNSKIVVRTGLVLLGITASLSAQTFPEALPDPIRARLEVRDRFLRSLPPTLSGNANSDVVRLLARWLPGQIVTVAFQGGDNTLRAGIAAAAQKWIANGNLKLDFGLNPQTGKYRECPRPIPPTQPTCAFPSTRKAIGRWLDRTA